MNAYISTTCARSHPAQAVYQFMVQHGIDEDPEGFWLAIDAIATSYDLGVIERRRLHAEIDENEGGILSREMFLRALLKIATCNALVVNGKCVESRADRCRNIALRTLKELGEVIPAP